MRDRTFYAGLIPICAIALGIGFHTVQPTPMGYQPVTVAQAPAATQVVRVVVDYPTGTATTRPTVTPTTWPRDTPLPTWAGQQEGRLYVIPEYTATAIPPVVHRLCIQVTPTHETDLTCQGIPFDLPGGWFV